jgi:hypothetical protein
MCGAQTSLTVTQALSDSQSVLHDSLLLEPLLKRLATCCRLQRVELLGSVSVDASPDSLSASTNCVCALPAAALCCLRHGRTQVGVSGCRQAPHGHQALLGGKADSIVQLYKRTLLGAGCT